MLAAHLFAATLAAAAPTVEWDLTVELETEGEAPDRVCLVTQVPRTRLESIFFTGIDLDSLVGAGVVTQATDDSPIVFDREAAADNAWFDTELDPMIDPVREAFDVMRTPPGDPTRCKSREPAGCAPMWRFSPPDELDGWTWAVMCSPDRRPADPGATVFLTVRAVDLDLGFTPFVRSFDLFGGGVQVRLDSVRTEGELRGANFQASVGVLGGDYHSQAAVPSFRGRVRLPLQPRCRTQKLRVADDPALTGAARRMVLLDAPRGDGACTEARFTADITTSCSLPSSDLDRGVFEIRVPQAVKRREHHAEIRVEHEAEGGTWRAACAAGSWGSHGDEDVVDLEPEQIRLRWRWPCFAETSAALRCPSATVRGASQPCAVMTETGGDTCEYSCRTLGGDQRSVDWPVTVDLEQADLGMSWRYELDALDSQRAGEFSPGKRRFVVMRGPRKDADGELIMSETGAVERWPGWWTQRRGDQIRGAILYQEDEMISVDRLGDDGPVVDAVTLEGARCRDHIEYNYLPGIASSRHYNRNGLDVTWPYVEMPPPDRSAFPISFGLNGGAGITVDPTGTRRAQPQFLLSADLALRSFYKAEKHRDRAAWMLGVRYFAFMGAKEHRTVVSESGSIERGTVFVARHGIAARFEQRFDRYDNLRTRLGYALTAGVGWTTPFSSRRAQDRIPIDRRIPFVLLQPELVFHYRILRAALFVAVIGPDPTFEAERVDDDPVVVGAPVETTPSTGDSPNGAGSWFLVPGFSLGVEL